MEMLIKILAAGMPIVGILVGATIQSYYSKRSDTKKQALTFKSQAYVDYLMCVSESARIGHMENSQISNLYSKAANAKTRIAVFGSKDVAKNLAEFIELGESINSNESASAFIGLCQAMREDYLDIESAPDMDSIISVLIGGDKLKSNRV